MTGLKGTSKNSDGGFSSYRRVAAAMMVPFEEDVLAVFTGSHTGPASAHDVAAQIGQSGTRTPVRVSLLSTEWLLDSLAGVGTLAVGDAHFWDARGVCTTGMRENVLYYGREQDVPGWRDAAIAQYARARRLSAQYRALRALRDAHLEEYEQLVAELEAAIDAESGISPGACA